MSFVVWNQIPGDYLEFGVWQGRSFSIAYHELNQQRRDHISLGHSDSSYEDWKSHRPRFVAFDSFEGVPDIEGAETMVDYAAGSYAASEAEFKQVLSRQNVPLDDVIVVKGWYADTCTPETRQEHDLDRVAVALIDCDLYESAVPVLDFLTDIVQQGSILIFVEWFRYKGSPTSGVQRACGEWLERNPHFELIEFWRQAPQAVSFLVNLREPLRDEALK